jgi:hypothetical protein
MFRNSHLLTLLLFATGNVLAVETEIPCFTVHLSAWMPAMQLGDDEAYVTPPSAIALTNDVARSSGSVEEFSVIPALDAKPSIHKRAYWHPDGDNIELVWTNGFSGIAMSLAPTTDGFKGTARTFWDFDRASQSSTVYLRKTSCE